MSNCIASPDNVKEGTNKLFDDYYHGFINKYELSRELSRLADAFFMGLAEELDKCRAELTGESTRKEKTEGVPVIGSVQLSPFERQLPPASKPSSCQ